MKEFLKLKIQELVFQAQYGTLQLPRQQNMANMMTPMPMYNNMGYQSQSSSSSSFTSPMASPASPIIQSQFQQSQTYQ